MINHVRGIPYLCIKLCELTLLKNCFKNMNIAKTLYASSIFFNLNGTKLKPPESK